MGVNEACEAKVLNNQCICTGFIEEACIVQGGIEFAVADQDIQGDIGFHAAGAAVSDCAGHFIGGKILCTAARVKGTEAHINGGGTALHGGAHAIRGAGGCEQLGEFKQFHFELASFCCLVALVSWERRCRVSSM